MWPIPIDQHLRLDDRFRGARFECFDIRDGKIEHRSVVQSRCPLGRPIIGVRRIVRADVVGFSKDVSREQKRLLHKLTSVVVPGDDLILDSVSPAGKMGDWLTLDKVKLTPHT